MNLGSDRDRQGVAAEDLAQVVEEYLRGQGETEVHCPRAKSPWTPCVARDGGSAVADDALCVGCGARPSDLLSLLHRDLDG